MATARTTAVLAVLAALSTGWMVFFEPRIATTTERRVSAKRVLDVTADEVERVVIRRDRWTSALIERVDATSFRVSEPRAAAADAGEVVQLLSLLEFLESRARLTGADADDAHRYGYGLTTPSLEVSLATADGREHHVSFGKELPTGGLYLHIRGQQVVHVVDPQVLKRASALLDRSTEGG